MTLKFAALAVKFVSALARLTPRRALPRDWREFQFGVSSYFWRVIRQVR